jgi:hypothetical protein
MIREVVLGTVLAGVGFLAGYVVHGHASPPPAPVARPALCELGKDDPLWSAITYMGQDNAELRFLAQRTDDVDRHLRGTPSDYAAASKNYDVLLGYLAREVYECGQEGAWR